VPAETTPAIIEMLERARAEGRHALLEHEGYSVAAALGFGTPRYVVVRDAAEITADRLSTLPGDTVVVKALAPDLPHKTDVGGIALVPRDAAATRRAVERMAGALAGRAVYGYALTEYVAHASVLGAELLVGLRHTDDFGPVVTVALGGVQTEYLGRHFDRGRGAAVFAPGLHDAAGVRSVLASKAFTALVIGGVRGTPAFLGLPKLVDAVLRLLTFAASAEGERFAELEINPLALTPAGAVALDVLARLADGEPAAPAPPRPTARLRSLLEPRTAAVIGVSGKANPGRTILRNMLHAGFPAEHLAVVKPGGGTIDGVRCVDDIADLPAPVDLLVVAVAAPHVPDLLDAVIAGRLAESLIVIPGGLGERNGTESREARLRASLGAARATAWGGPVLNGGNCLGIRSVPGRYDTMFIPPHKLPPAEGPASPLAIVAQSGAFAVSRASKLLGLNPRYMISIGNQTDLTVGDYLTHLRDDPDVRVFGCYVEGFRGLDGRRWLDAAAEIVASGREVVLYRAGRSAAGAEAMASHTAAVAGNYEVVRELAESVGVVVADTLDDFDDLIRLFSYLDRREVAGLRLGAVSNAGFECVAIADNLGSFALSPLSAEGDRRLREVLRTARLDDVVEPRNPVDLTPIMPDAGYEAAVRAVLEDESVDVGIVGCVPHTPALNTLAAGAGHGEDFTREDGIARRLARVARDSPKAWVAVVDAGPLYDAMAEDLLAHGVPTFRTADRALRLFELYCLRRLRAGSARRGDTAGS